MSESVTGIVDKNTKEEINKLVDNGLYRSTSSVVEDALRDFVDDDSTKNAYQLVAQNYAVFAVFFALINIRAGLVSQIYLVEIAVLIGVLIAVMYLFHRAAAQALERLNYFNRGV